MGGVDKVKRQHDQGRLTVRERIDRLIDKNSFHEIGAISGIAEYDENSELKHLTPANCVFGRGRIDGRTVVVVGDDFTVRGGSADASISAKPLMAEEMAHDFRLPIIRVIEGSGGGGSVKTIETRGRGQSARRGRRHALVLVHDREHGARARGGARARLGRGPWRGAACRQPLFGHDQEFGDVRRGSAGGEAPRPGSDQDRNSAAPRSRPAPAASTMPSIPRRRRSNAPGVFCPICRRRSTTCRRPRPVPTIRNARKNRC